MLIFIGWSGDSHEVGQVLSDWLPKVNPAFETYISDKITPGERWVDSLIGTVKQADFAILCLTSASLPAPWIFFETGALCGRDKPIRIVPFLLDIDSSESEALGPLAYFQATPFKKDALRKLVSALNSACGENQLTEETLNGKFEALYPELDEKLRAMIPAKKQRYIGHSLYLEDV